MKGFLNYTSSSVQRLAEQFLLRGRGTVAMESFFMLLIDMVAFFGNMMVLTAVCRNSTLRRTIPNMYIITLAVSDFLMSILGIPPTVVSVMLGKWPSNDFLCQFQGFCILLMCAVSLQSLALTAVNRYFRIVRSQSQYRRIFTLKSTKIMIAVLWVVAIFAPLPYVVANHKFLFRPGKAFCGHDIESLLKGYGAFLVLLYVTIPLFIIIICYSKVFVAVRKHNAISTLRRHHEETNLGRLTVEEIDVTYTLLCVVLGFLICWTPVVILDIIDFINRDWLLPRPAYLAYTCFGYASTAVNPIVYGIRNRAFRREYYYILTGCGRISRRNASTSTISSRIRHTEKELTPRLVSIGNLTATATINVHTSTVS